MAPTLYTLEAGIPTRGVVLLIRHLNLNIELRPVDLFKGEHMTPEFLEMNPAHTVPFLKDGDFIINESRAIAQYLVESRVSESSVLGRFAKKRAKVNQMLYFDMTNLSVKCSELYRPVVRNQSTVIAEDAKKAVLESLALLDVYLRKGYWAAGEFVSIADFFILATVETLVQFGVKLDKYVNVQDWYKRSHTHAGFDENAEGAKKLADYVMSKLTEELVWE